MKELSKQAQLDRILCQRSLYYLCKEVMGYRDLVPHVHGDYCQFLTHTKFGRFRQATLPRSWFKTWVGTIGKSIWLTLPDEEGLFKEIYPYKGANVRILIASNVIDNAAKMVHKIKSEWENNDRLKAAFPELIPDYNKTRWSDHAAEVRRTINATEATYTAVGVGGSVISQHFDHLMEDDLIYAKKDDFTGQELMPTQEDIDNAIGWHKLAFSLLANPQQGCIDNIGTRWAPQDIIDYIRRFETHYNCFEISGEDAETGKENWPERYDRRTLDQILATQGARIYETQYLNRPRPLEDIVFKIGYLNTHESLSEFPRGMEYKTIVDLAGWGDGKGLANNVILTGAKDSNNHLWIARIDAGRYTPTEVIAIFRDHARQFDSRVHIEEVQYQRAVRHFAKQEMQRTGDWYSIEQLKYDGKKNAKDLRIRALEPIVSNGGIHILSHMKNLKDEMEFYPQSRTVDILDCMGYLLRVAKPPVKAVEPEKINVYSIEAIEKELKNRAHSAHGLPFDYQLTSKGA